MQRDVEEGRPHFSVSDRGRDGNHGDEAAKLFREGEMPTSFDLPAHPKARLSDGEREEFAGGLIATFGDASEPTGGGGA